MWRVKMCTFFLLIFSCCVGENSTKLEVEVRVREKDDAVLPCSFSPVQDIASKVFDWKKVNHSDSTWKEVFLFSKGPVYNQGNAGQDSQFSGRVTHFTDKLKNGNASIKISSATVADSGTYTCVFPRDNRQTSVIRLLVDPTRPNVPVSNSTDDGPLLTCEVVRDSRVTDRVLVNGSGVFVSSEEPPVFIRNGSNDVTLTMHETKLVRCRFKLKENGHENFTEVFVHVQVETFTMRPLGILNALALIVCLIVALLYLAKKMKTPCSTATSGNIACCKVDIADVDEESPNGTLMGSTADGSSHTVKNPEDRML